VFQIAADDMLDSLRIRAESKATSKANTVPDAILRQMVSLQSSSNEFLRHFWAAIVPPREGDITFAAKATAAQKAARAKKMIGYLEKTAERVDQVVEDAQGDKSVDPERVKAVR
jgi:transcription initiation factor TFIIH subunit 1